MAVGAGKIFLPVSAGVKLIRIRSPETIRIATH
jgi:hypothetical protein